ncbi:hypothetical protein EV360DRAFT_83822 [Lentinula raphanica]|nr:hypothetical protein EV360DRAFT_83822 [Lentinula raphanica]
MTSPWARPKVLNPFTRCSIHPLFDPNYPTISSLRTSWMSATTTSFLSGSSNSSTTDAPGGLLAPTSTSPLILVFLALGLLSATAIAILGWKRANYLRAERARANRRNEEARMRLGIRLGTDGHVDIGEITAVDNQEPPKLWDLTAISRSTYLSDDWAHGSEREKIEEMSKVNWKTIMPVSLTWNPHETSVKEKQTININARLATTEQPILFEIPYARWLERLKRVCLLQSLLHMRDTHLQSIDEHNGLHHTENSNSTTPRVLPADEGRDERVRPLVEGSDTSAVRGIYYPQDGSYEVAVVVAMPQQHVVGTDRKVYQYELGICYVDDRLKAKETQS